MPSLEETMAAANLALADTNTGIGAFLAAEQARYDALAAGYEALAANLRQVVSDQMRFTADWRPSQPENPVSGGSFQTLGALVTAAPRGAYITARLYNDEVYVQDTQINIHNQTLALNGQHGPGDPDRPVITWDVQDIAGLSQIMGKINCWGNATVRMSRIKNIIAAKPAAAWHPDHDTIITASVGLGAQAHIHIREAMFIGPGGAGIASCSYGGMVLWSAYVAQVDTIAIVPDAANGICLISSHSLTLTNGAATHSGGTTGTNLLIK